MADLRERPPKPPALRAAQGRRCTGDRVADLLAVAKRLAGSGRSIIIPGDLARDRVVHARQEVNVKTSCVVPYFFYFIDCRGEVRVCYDETNQCVIGNILMDPWQDLRAKLAAFRKRALNGTCSMACHMNIDTSSVN